MGAPHSAPFGTRWKPAGNLHSLSMCAVMLVLLFVCGVGNAWGTKHTYDFTSTSKWWTTAAKTTNVSSATSYTSFYDADKKEWTVSAKDNKKFVATGYFMLGKSGATLTMPTFSGEKITSIKIYNSSGCSTNVKVNIYTTGGTAASTETKFSSTSSNYTFDIGSSYQNSQLRVQVTNAYNVQITQIDITTESSGYTITLDKNGGSTDGTGTVAADATSVTISTAPARTGYEPEGYYTTSDCATKIATTAGVLQPSISVGGNTWTNASSQWKKGGAATFYTNWRAKTYDVTLDRNGATTGSTSVTMTYDSNTHTAITNPTKDGYVFGGYWTGSGGTGTLVINTSGELQANVTNYTGAGGIWTRAIAGTTLYAKWTPTYTVTYNGNGNSDGSVPTDATNYPSGTTVTVKTNSGSLVKTGWTFAGWNANSTGTSTTYAAGSGTFTISSNTTLYAKWTCTVTWSVAGSTNVYSDQTITYNPSGSKITSVPTPPNPASYCGDKFVGWTSDENYVHGTSNLFTTVDGSPNLNSIGSTTFYAVFADYDE